MIELDEDYEDFPVKHCLNGRVHTNQFVSTKKDNTEYMSQFVCVGSYKNNKLHSVHRACAKFYKKNYMGVHSMCAAYEGKLHRDNGSAVVGGNKKQDYWVLHGIHLDIIYDEII